MTLPHNAVLELTYKCNHKCKFCSCPWYAPNGAYTKGDELNLEQWKTAIDKLCNLGVRHFSISGGECLLKDCLPDILRYINLKIKEYNFSSNIVLISNGLIMSEEFLSLFKETNVHLSMSLPGLNTFEYHTGVDNADGVLHWFKRAKEIGLTSTVNITVTKQNIHELFESISEGIISGASSVLLNRFLPGGRGLNYCDDLLLSVPQLNEMLETAEDVLSLCNRQGFIGTEFPKCIIKDPQRLKHVSVGTYCAAAKAFFVIGPAGEIRVCNHSPRIIGNILNDNIIEDQEYWSTFAESKYHPVICANCVDLPICDCGCREVSSILTGSVNNVESSIKGSVTPR